MYRATFPRWRPLRHARNPEEARGPTRTRRRPLTGDVVRVGGRGVGRRAAGVEPRRRSAARRRRLPGVGRRRRDHRRFAADHGLRIACQGGGHNAGPIEWRTRTLLVKTEAAARDHDRRPRAPGARRGRGARGGARRRGRRARSRLPRRHLPRRRDRGLRRRRRDQLAGATARAGLQHASSRSSSSRPTGGSSAPTARPSRICSGGCAAAAATSRAITALELELFPIERDLRRRPVLADRARRRDPLRLARLGRGRPRGVHLARPAAEAPGAAVHPRPPSRPLVRARRSRVPRERGRRRGARAALARPRPRDRHVRADPAAPRSAP